MTETTTPTADELAAAEYHELQAFAKDAGVPATGKAEDLRETLREHFGLPTPAEDAGDDETGQERAVAAGDQRVWRALVAMAGNGGVVVPAGGLFLADEDDPRTKPGNAVEVDGDELPAEVAAALEG